jgi:hypothetical protein
MNLERSNLPDGCRLSVSQTVSNFDAHQQHYPVKELLRRCWQQVADNVTHSNYYFIERFWPK